MSIEYIKGDLFDTDCKYIAHGVNCQGVMGSGVAKTVKERFPGAFKAYKEYTKTIISDMRRGALLGTNLIVEDKNKVIINCFTQYTYLNAKISDDDWDKEEMYYWPDDEYFQYISQRQVNYDAVARCFERLSHMVFFDAWGHLDDFDTLAMPKIGAGLGRGDWTIIEAIIERTLVKGGFNVKVYEL